MVPSYCPGLAIPLSEAADDTPRLVRAALWGLKQVDRPGYRYAKAGVMLMEIRLVSSRQHILFSDEVAEKCSVRLMQTLDSINQKMGKDTLLLVSSGIDKGWRIKRETGRHATPRAGG